MNKSRQKSYADRRRRPLELQVRDQVFLQISPTKGSARFGMSGKVSPTNVHWAAPNHIESWGGGISVGVTT